MVAVEGYLEGLDLTDALKFLLKIGVLEVLWNGAHKDVVGHELLFVASEELLVELEGSAWLLSNLEELHGFDGLAESFGFMCECRNSR